MRQWEIYEFPHPTASNPHPCVVISPDQLARNEAVPFVNVIACTSLSGGSKVRDTEVALDAADDLAHLSVARCQVILSFSKSAAGKRYGEVSIERRRQIGRKIIDLWGLLNPVPPSGPQSKR